MLIENHILAFGTVAFLMTPRTWIWLSSAPLLLNYHALSPISPLLQSLLFSVSPPSGSKPPHWVLAVVTKKTPKNLHWRKKQKPLLLLTPGIWHVYSTLIVLMWPARELKAWGNQWKSSFLNQGCQGWNRPPTVPRPGCRLKLRYFFCGFSPVLQELLVFRTGRSLMVHHPVDEEKNRNQTLCWLRARGRLMENKLPDSSWSGIDCARLRPLERNLWRFSDQARIWCGFFFVLCCQGRTLFIYGIEIGPQS